LANSMLETMDSFPIDAVSSDRVEVERDFDTLNLIVGEVQKVHKIKGFILKNSARAMYNLDDSGDIFELALLSSEIFETSSQLFEATAAGPLNSVVLKGDLFSVLCLCVGENQLSIFLDRSVDCNVVLDMMVRRRF
jgi:hypothetical protein